MFADQYPYVASGTSISGALVPRWAQIGGGEALTQRIGTPEDRTRLREDMLENLDRRGGAARLQFQFHEADPSIEGSTLQQVADERGMEPVDMAIELLKAGGAGLVSFNMREADVELLMRQPWTMTASDGGLTLMGQGVPHPRCYGTFPRKIRRYVLDRRVIDLATAVRSMTLMSATVFGMTDRGAVRPGAIADIVLFDLERLRDVATYQDPHRLSEGIVHVLVNGQLAVENESFSDETYGKVLSLRE